MEERIGPSSSFFYSQRLRLHYVDWGNPEKPLLLLIHGGRDHARNWDWVARALRNDWHIVAPDLRGHGDSSWAIGGMYSMPEFVLDISSLLEAIGEFPVTIIGHSLGGAIALQYTGVFPERVRRLVAMQLGSSEVRSEDRLFEDLGMESIDLVNVVANLEDRYRIAIGEEHLAAFSTVGDLERLVARLTES